MVSIIKINADASEWRKCVRKSPDYYKNHK